jgi:hypothetical protein
MEDINLSKLIVITPVEFLKKQTNSTFDIFRNLECKMQTNVV